MSELWQRMRHLPRRVAMGAVVGACVAGYGMGLAMGWPPTSSGTTRETAGGGIGVTPTPITTPAPRPQATTTPPGQTPVFIVPSNSATSAPDDTPTFGKHGARRGDGRDEGGGHGGGRGGGKHGGGHGPSGGHGHGK